MKRIIGLIVILTVGLLMLNAQEKFDRAEKELTAISDSLTQSDETAKADSETTETESFKSTRIESEEDWGDWDKEWDEWRENRQNEYKSSKKHGYFRGGAGGWDFYLMDLNADALNTKLSTIGLNPFDEQIFMTGGGGWGFIGHGIRIGGMGAHGRLVSSGKPDVPALNLSKNVTLSINYGGFTIDKVFHPLNKTELYLGTMIGGGNAQLNFKQWGGPLDWDQLWNGFDNDSLAATGFQYSDYQNKIECGYFVMLPYVGFRYNFFRWAALGVNVGYLYMHQNQDGWEMDGKEINAVPDIDFSNVVYRLNIYFGG
jgi:hypothetical protein